MIKLMHLEDDPDILAISQIALELTGRLDVVQFSSGEEALAKVPEIAPDAFLLDVMMPGMSGPQVLAELRRIPGYESTPAIFMTARVQPSEVAELLEAGAIEVIWKPFDPMTLGQQIIDALSKAGVKAAA